VAVFTRDRLLWRSITFIDMALRVGGGDGFVQRYLREVMVEVPEVAKLRAWVGGELKRGYSRDIATAGRALAAFNARPLVSSIAVPCATIVTTRDRLVTPRKQHQLAAALGGPVFAVDGDHDAPLVKAREFAIAMSEAVAAVDHAANGGRPVEDGSRRASHSRRG
jgi:hypothetical protein